MLDSTVIAGASKRGGSKKVAARPKHSVAHTVVSQPKSMPYVMRWATRGRFVLTPGQHADIIQAETLLTGETPACVLADKDYDSDALLALIATLEAEAVIPAKRNRTQPRPLDPYLYAKRNQVERLFNRLKHYRRLATRNEKTARNCSAFWHIASIITLLL